MASPRSGFGAALGVLSGIAAVANRERARKQQEQMAALQLLSRDPGMRLTTAAPGTTQPSPFLSRIFGSPIQRVGPGAPVVDLGGTPLTVEPLPTFETAEVEDFPEFAGLPKTQAATQFLSTLRRRKQERGEDFAAQTVRDLRQTQQRQQEREGERQFRREERVMGEASQAARLEEQLGAQEKRLGLQLGAQEGRLRTELGARGREGELERASREKIAGMRAAPKADTITPDEAAKEIVRLRQLESKIIEGRMGNDTNMLIQAMAASQVKSDVLKELGIMQSPAASPEKIEEAKQNSLRAIRAAIASLAPHTTETFRRMSGLEEQPAASVGGVPITGFRRVR